MFGKYLMMFIAVTWMAKALSLEYENMCPHITEKTQMVNGEVVKRNETVLKCCDGYITVKQECKPLCTNCSNGVCIKPKVCECNKGYLWNATSRSCEPMCDCLHGYCITPHQCVCFKGYEKPSLTSNDCEPICNPKCPSFSTCTKPQTCECYFGYEKNPHTEDCDLQCLGDIFRPDFETNQCVLKNCSCSSGGYCLYDYDECTCYDGFRRTNHLHCEPECREICENAECVGPNQCECWPDYHATDKPNICEPNDLCQRKLCENGECLQTGECKCKKGFTKSFTFKGQILCETIAVFIGKIMSIILGIPLALASIVLLVVYIVAKKKNKQNAPQYGQACGEDDGDNVIYAYNQN